MQQVQYDQKILHQYAVKWLDMQESEPPVYFQIGRDIDHLTNPSLSESANLLIMKEKLIIWVISSIESQQIAFTVFAPLYNNLTKGFDFVNKNKAELEPLVKLCFLRYVMENHPQGDRLQTIQIRERLRFLDVIFNISIEGGYELTESVVIPKKFEMPQDLQRIEEIISSATGENLNAFLSNTDTQIDQLIKTHMKTNKIHSEYEIRMLQIQYWLSFNHNLKYQNKIINAFKILKEKNESFLAIQEKVIAMEIQFFMQVKYHKLCLETLLNLMVGGQEEAEELMLALTRQSSELIGKKNQNE